MTTNKLTDTVIELPTSVKYITTSTLDFNCRPIEMFVIGFDSEKHQRLFFIASLKVCFLYRKL